MKTAMLLIVALALLIGCSSSPSGENLPTSDTGATHDAAVAGCLKDTDCKGGYICNPYRGVCTEPGDDAGADVMEDAAADAGGDSGVDVGGDVDMPDGWNDGGWCPGRCPPLSACTDDRGGKFWCAWSDDGGCLEACQPDAGIWCGVQSCAQEQPDGSIEDGGADGGEDAGPDGGCEPQCAGRCGGSDQCGGACPDNCVAPQTCGGGSVLHVCGCTPACDGKCGGADSCGGVCPDTCTAPQTCGGGGTQYVCGCTYEGNTAFCTRLNKDCGNVTANDNCGAQKTVNCGSCTSPQTCGGGGTSKVCGCTPSCSGKCGGQSDGCTGTCADPCNSHSTCNAGTCTCNAGYLPPACNACAAGYIGYPNCIPSACGYYGAACCASDVCDSGLTCNNGTCVSDTCSGKGDFTLCNLITVPDRSYDICVGGTCVSPGCGDQTCNEPGPHFILPDTDQRTCYDNTTTMTCTAFPCGKPPPDFCGQDAQYGWDTTHAQTARYTKTEQVGGEPLVTDNVTGLEWQGCPAKRSGVGCTTGAVQTKTWVDALTYCDGLNWAGHTDWRLPDSYELQSIADYGRSNPAIDTTAFPATLNTSFWSSSSSAGDTTLAWYVYFSKGSVSYSDYKAAALYVRCVRGVPNPQPARFSKTEPMAGQPVVNDNTTGLVWQGCPAGLTGSTCESGSYAWYTWRNALRYCEWTTWGNQTDWRLPSVTELNSLVDTRRVSPSIDATVFPSTPSTLFWSSSSDSVDTGNAWQVNFYDGSVYVFWPKFNSYNFRCVRGGP